MTQQEKNIMISAIKSMYSMNQGFTYDVYPSASRLWQLENQFGVNLDSKIYNLVNIPVNNIIDILSSKSEQSLPLKVVILQRLIHNNYLSPAHTQQVLSFLKVNDLKKYTAGHQTTMETFLETVHDIPYKEFIFESMECYVIWSFEDTLINVLGKSQQFIDSLYLLFGIARNADRYMMNRTGVGHPISEIEQIFDLATYMMTMIELETGMFLAQSPFLGGRPVPSGPSPDTTGYQAPPSNIDIHEPTIKLPGEKIKNKMQKNIKIEKLDDDYGF